MIAYFAAAAQVLARPKVVTDTDSDLFAEIAFAQGRLVSNPWNQPALHRTVGGERLVHFFGRSVPATTTALFREIIGSYYAIAAEAQGKTGGRFIAEKFNLNQSLRAAARLLFGELREIVLVRDPRDFLCSARAFWKTGKPELMATLRSESTILEHIHREARPDVLFVRYEDLILDPEPTRHRIYNFLGLDLSHRLEVPPDPELLARHATTSSPAASVGRWARELAKGESEACCTEFDGFMRLFGYDRSP